MQIPNLACLLCHQYSPTAVCDYCKFDTRSMLQLNYDGNLLRYPVISKQFRHSAYDGLLALGEYAWPFNALIQRMKFSRCMASTDILARWFVEQCIDTETLLPDCLLPVPVHFRRFLHRRFNQSAQLAKRIGEQIQRPVCYDWASRKLGKAQHTLSKADRLLNLRNAFSVSLPASFHHVAIIDDVMTTGVTADVLAKQLRTQHPELIVDIWVMALTCKTPLRQRTR